MQNTKVRKAVVAAAGFGTRFLPQTKAMPKEMLPLIDKPVIQYVVEELVEAGIEDIIIVTGANKRSIEDHFDLPSQDLTDSLISSGKQHLLDEIRGISSMANFVYIRQKGPYGNATPLLNAEHLVDGEPFIYTFADDFIVSNPNRFEQLIETYNQHGCSVLAAIRATSDDDYSRYGMVGGNELDGSKINIKQIIEKPGSPENAPSDVCVVSGYLFTPDIFEHLRQAQAKADEGAETGYSDGVELMLKANKQVIAKIIENGTYYDSGNKLEYLKTIIDFASKNEAIGDDFNGFLKEYVKNL